MEKPQFELSLWESYIPDGKDYFTERKKFILASDKLESLNSAYDVTLKENINGERTLDFKITYRYFDENGNEVDNPFFEYLTNEARIKLRDGSEYEIDMTQDPSAIISALAEEDTEEKWIDFTIKNIAKDSEKNTAQISCKEIFVNELGKNGWSVTLDTELENNYGNVIELGEAILDGSDWEIDEDSYNPIELNEQPLMLTHANRDIQVQKVTDTTEWVTIPANSPMYLFYSDCELVNDIWTVPSTSENMQFIYRAAAFTEKDLDDNYIIIDDDSEYNYQVTNLINKISTITPTGANGSIHLTGRKIVKQQKTTYKNEVNKYCKIWKALPGHEIVDPSTTTVYSYTETHYSEISYVRNYLTNTSDFTSQSGWSKNYKVTSEGDFIKEKAILQTFPLALISKILENEKYFNYLKLNFDKSEKAKLFYFNEGPKTNNLQVSKDDEYIIRFRGRWLKNDITDYTTNDFMTSNLPDIKFYLVEKDYQYSETASEQYGNATLSWTGKTINTGTLDEERGYVAAAASRESSPTVGTTYVDDKGYLYTKFVVTKSSNLEDNSLLLRIECDTSVTDYQLCIEDIQLFKYQIGDIITDTVDEEGEDVINKNCIIFPDDALASTIEDTEVFFYIDENGDVKNISNTESYYEAVIENNSIRNISVKESNYFNNIQSLAELFELWPKFIIKHQKDGKILTIDGKAQKFIKFQRYSPNGEVINQAGFKKGINTKKINRKVDSNEIATKVIVINNDQEYATDGTCSISRATANPTGENEIYNFNYYISKGLLDSASVFNDFYGDYFIRLKDCNNKYDAYSKQLTNYTLANLDFDAKKTVYEAAITSLTEENEEIAADLAVYNENSDQYKNKQITYIENLASLENYTTLNEALTANQSSLETLIDEIEEKQAELKALKTLIKKEMYSKYSQFILEGTWNDDQYIDDNLYYFDGCKVASVSAFPKVTYDLQVIDVDSIEDYKLYKFKIGERSYIEDTDFFGYENYTFGNEVIKTPKKIEVIVSERSRNFSDPSKSTISVKNYKNQFEELFQKIAASSQQLQYASGSYERAASAILNNGTVQSSILEDTLAQNNVKIQNSVDGSVTWDENGILVKNPNNTMEMLKIQNGKILATSNGGVTWQTGISGSGINTSLLEATQIDVDKINLVSGSEPAFVWDSKGIKAYRGEDSGYNTNKYVNYNQYGIYGTTDATTLETAIAAATKFDDKVDAINNNANFALGWDGLHLNSNVKSGRQGITYSLKIKPDGLFFLENLNETTTNTVFSLDKDGLKIASGVIEADVENKAYTEFTNGKIGDWYIDSQGLHYPVNSYDNFINPTTKDITVSENNKSFTYNNVLLKLNKVIIDNNNNIYNGNLNDSYLNRCGFNIVNGQNVSINTIDSLDNSYGRIGSPNTNIPRIFANNVYGTSSTNFKNGLAGTDLSSSIETVKQLYVDSDYVTTLIYIDESSFLSTFPQAETKSGSDYPLYTFTYDSDTQLWKYNNVGYYLSQIGIVVGEKWKYSNGDTITVQCIESELVNYTKLIELIADKVKIAT